MRRFIHWPSFFLCASITLIVAWAVNGGLGSGFLVTAGIVALAILLNGILAVVEDEAPGGFNNPLPPGQDADESSDHGKT